MAFRVHLTHGATRDLEKLYDHISAHDSPERARYVLERIEKSFARLSGFPQRGTIPKELAAFGIREFREVFFKPYRLIYFIERKAVYVVLIADGRRDMRTLLQQRLLGV